MNEFKDKMRQLSEEQLVVVLKSKSGYREEAYEAAIAEALERGIIGSEEDLKSGEFEQIQRKKEFIPVGGSKEQLTLVKGSLIRSLMIVGFIPMIYFVMGFLNEIQPAHWYAFGAGTIWLGVLFFVRKTNQAYKLWLLPLVVAGSIFYRIKVMGNVQVLDMVVLSILFIIVIFAVLFLRKTINALKES